MAESTRRYPEIYDWMKKTEAEGRDQMTRGLKMLKRAIVSALGYGVLCTFLFTILIVHFFPSIAVGQNSAQEVLTAGVVPALIVAALIYKKLRSEGQRLYDAGLALVLEAQRLLVAIDTEENTREMAHLLQTLQSPASK